MVGCATFLLPEESTLKRTMFRRALIATICLGLAVDAVPARADTFSNIKNEVVLGSIGVGAAVGVGVFFAFHHGHAIKGCAAKGPDGLEIRTQNGANVYRLSGATAELKAGELVRLKGKRKRAQEGDVPMFVVRGVTKDYGACTVAGRP